METNAYSLDQAVAGAYFLTGSMKDAERIALEEIDLWNAGEEGEEELFTNILTSAAKENTRLLPVTEASRLPSELRAILALTPELRRCFVLRMVFGLSRQRCASLLDTNVCIVDRDTCEAMRMLAAESRPVQSTTKVSCVSA